MYTDKQIWIGATDSKRVVIYPSMANRHGLIAGATGTGKTTTLRVMAESFSDCGVPVFLADVKGDIANICSPGSGEGFVGQRVADLGLEAQGFAYHGCPTAYWDIFENHGMALRTTISEMGPLLLSRILGLNATQEAVLTVVFKIADDEGLLLIDTKDLRAMLQYVGENAKEYSLTYGNMSKQSMAAIIRAVVALEAEGGEQFFGEPALRITDWIRKNEDGKGYVNVLDCQTLINSPTLYSTFMLWMLSELYETLPEVGDMEKPRIVFFFDEAHLLFENASKSLVAKIEQVVKLIRSKGVGIYFITQSPKDIPDGVLAQLGNKVQHALHAYTPAEQKAVKAAAMSFRVNPAFDTYEALQNLGKGEAIVSVLDEQGVPTIAERCFILPPQCGMDALDDARRTQLINQDDLYLKYRDFFDRDSAYEFLQRKAVADEEAAAKAAEEAAQEKERLKAEAEAEKQRQKEEAAAEKARLREEAVAEKARQKEEAAAEKARLKEIEDQKKAAEKEALKKKQATNRVVKNVASSVGGTVGREVMGNLGKSVGGSFGKKLGGSMGASLGRGLLGGLFSK